MIRQLGQPNFLLFSLTKTEQLAKKRFNVNILKFNFRI